MGVKDPFSYSARWDSVGLDCAFCIHFRGPVSWPDLGKASGCYLHQISLSVELGKSGYKEGEWFCKDFSDNGRAFARAVKEFDTIKGILAEDTFFGAYGNDGFLKEIPFNELE